ncbi:MAG: MFS transporter [Gammaproteobacteria bacterium]
MSNSPQARPVQTWQRSRVLVTVSLFGFASGLPLALTGSTLQAWFTQAGVDLKTIGAMSLIGLPYLYKFLWAPLLDRYVPVRGGRRRGWLFVTQAILAAILLALAELSPARDLTMIVVLVATLALMSATQDIVVDAYRAEVLPPDERGFGAGLSIAGYRLAMIVSGAGVLLLADARGFEDSLRALAVLMAASWGVTWWASEPPEAPGTASSLRADLLASLGHLLRRPAFPALAALVVAYKLGDAFAGSLSMTFFLRGQGFSLTEIGATYKALGIAATLLGGIAGGLWMKRLGLYRALLWFGLLQAITNLGFWLLAVSGKSLAGMIVVVALENLSGGMGTSALVALLISLCDRQFTATHFALLSALASMPRVLIGPFAGVAAEWGWPTFFAGSLLLALPGLLLVAALGRPLRALDTPPGKD